MMITHNEALRARGIGTHNGYRPGDLVHPDKIRLVTKGLRAQTETAAYASNDIQGMFVSMGNYTYNFVYNTSTTPVTYQLKKFNSRTYTLVDTLLLNGPYQLAEVDIDSNKMFLYGNPKHSYTQTILECTHVDSDTPNLIGREHTMRSSIRKVSYEHNLLYVLYFDDVIEVVDISTANWEVITTITTPHHPALSHFGKAYDLVPRGDGSSLFLVDEADSKMNTYCNVALFNWRTQTELWTRMYYVSYYGQVEINYWRARDELILFLHYDDHQAGSRHADLHRLTWNSGTSLGTFRLSADSRSAQNNIQLDAKGIYGIVSESTTKAWWFNPATNTISTLNSSSFKVGMGYGYIWEGDALFILSRLGDNLAKYQLVDVYQILS